MLFSIDICINFVCRWGNLTWLELALLTSDPAPTFDVSFLQQIHYSTISGLREDQVETIEDADFIYVSDDEVSTQKFTKATEHVRSLPLVLGILFGT